MSKRWVGNSRDRKFSYARTKQWHRDHAPYGCCQGKHVVVTGGCSGIGLELAREAIRRNAKAVSLIDLNDAGKLLRELEDEAADGLSAVFLCKISVYRADVSGFDQVDYSPVLTEIPFACTASAVKACFQSAGMPGSSNSIVLLYRYQRLSQTARFCMVLWMSSAQMLELAHAVRHHCVVPLWSAAQDCSMPASYCLLRGSDVADHRRQISMAQAHLFHRLRGGWQGRATCPSNCRACLLRLHLATGNTLTFIM